MAKPIKCGIITLSIQLLLVIMTTARAQTRPRQPKNWHIGWEFGKAKVDTITPLAKSTRLIKLKEQKNTFSVFIEDSTGKRLTSADLWDRQVTLDSSKTRYNFTWTWFRRDSLLGITKTTLDRQSLSPLFHHADFGKRGHKTYQFKDSLVVVPLQAQTSKADSSFRVNLKPAAFAFPMDLELYPLLPFRQVGQQFSIAFYEPGRLSSAYYAGKVIAHENLSTGGGGQVMCWVLRMDYRPNAYATFWISERTREVLKMKEYVGQGRYRYKVKLY